MGFRDCMMRCGSQQPAQLNLRVDEHGLGRFPAIHPELLELPAAATEEYRILGFQRASAENETSETWSRRQAGRLGCSQRWAENSHQIQIQIQAMPVSTQQQWQQQKHATPPLHPSFPSPRA
jgi:hypothetical protein